MIQWLLNVYNTNTVASFVFLSLNSCCTHGMKHVLVAGVHNVNTCIFSITFSTNIEYIAYGCGSACGYLFPKCTQLYEEDPITSGAVSHIHSW